MNVFMTGGTGFVGGYLSDDYLRRGWQVQATGTSAVHPLADRADFNYIRADTTKPGPWQNAVQNADVIVNLAGRNIFHYWTDRYKRQIRDSRILTTRNLVDALDPGRPVTLLNASAVGYYGSRGDEVLAESADPGDDFLARVSGDWEAEALEAGEKGARVILMRFGVVLGRGGGALARMTPAFKGFAGGPLGRGTQWFPWIHIQDLAAATAHLIENEDAAGPYNFCAPGILEQRRFARILGRTLNRPAVMKTPAFAMKLIMGEMGGVLLSSQRAVPERLSASGFEFRYPDLGGVLEDILQRTTSNRE